MASAEEKIENLEGKYSDLHTVVNVLAANVNNLTNELRDFKNEMRTQNLLRAKEISELGKKHEDDLKEVNDRIESKFDKLSEHLQNISIAAFVGVGAMVITSVIGIAAMVWSVINK